MTRSTHETQSEVCESEHLQQDATLLSAKARALTENLTVYRAIPQQQLRMVGPWCFVDHFGPVATKNYRQFDVAPHPHIGLQTITWLFSGELKHLDSLGYEQPLRRGQLNLMTAGNGISHAEVAEQNLQQPLHGLQLWCALPQQHEQVAPSFEHYRELPHFAVDDVMAELILGKYESYRSPGTTFHPCIAMLLTTPKNAQATIKLNKELEYALYVVSGSLYLTHPTNAKFNQGHGAHEHELISLGANRSELTLAFGADTRVLLLGGEAFPQPVTMWWNYVSHNAERIRQADTDWQQGHARFGKVAHYQGERLLGPAIPSGLGVSTSNRKS